MALTVSGGVVYNLFSLGNNLKKETIKLRSEIGVLEEENEKLIRDIEYFKNKDNLLKELKSQFNYREVGEGIIIVVPEYSSTTR